MMAIESDERLGKGPVDLCSEERPESYARRAVAQRTFEYVSTGSAESRHFADQHHLNVVWFWALPD